MNKKLESRKIGVDLWCIRDIEPDKLYSLREIALQGWLLGMGYWGVYNAVVERKSVNGSRPVRVDDNRLKVIQSATGDIKSRRFKVRGMDILDYLQNVLKIDIKKYRS